MIKMHYISGLVYHVIGIKKNVGVAGTVARNLVNFTCYRA